MCRAASVAAPLGRPIISDGAVDHQDGIDSVQVEKSVSSRGRTAAGHCSPRGPHGRAGGLHAGLGALPWQPLAASWAVLQARALCQHTPVPLPTLPADHPAAQGAVPRRRACGGLGPGAEGQEPVQLPGWVACCPAPLPAGKTARGCGRRTGVPD